MSQPTIHDTLQTILDQLYGNQHDLTAKPSNTLTAVEIARILSGQVHEVEKNIETIQENSIPPINIFVIEKEHFEKELGEANNLYQIQYYRPICCYRKLIGRFIIFGKKVARRLLKFLIEPIVLQQSQFNAAIVRTLNSIRNHHVVFQEAINYLCNEEKKHNAAINDLRLDTNKAIESLSNVTQEELKKMNKELQEQIILLQQQSHQMQEDIKNAVKQQEENIYDTIDYFKFQQNMRGSCAEIKEQQKSYVVYFEGCHNVVDLGCGRGEFLETLRDHDINAVGVDSYLESVKYCKMKGLQVSQGDVAQFLHEQKNDSIDGVFSAQLIEHITVGKILELCKESYRVMKPDSYIVLETPNPTCLSTYMNSFYLDPSHKNPVHPRLMEYLMQECGFRNIQILYTEASKTNYHLPLLDVDHCKNLKEFNDGVNFLSDIIFGSQDYAIIAQK